MAEEYQAELARIGALVLRKREAKNWSQEDLAHELGSSVSTVSRWERAKEPPSKRYRKKLAALFQIDSALLIPAEPSTQSQLDRIEAQLAEMNERLGRLGLSDATKPAPPGAEAEAAIAEAESALEPADGAGQPAEAPPRIAASRRAKPKR